MEKLTLEQKAKAYDIAVEGLRNAFYNDNNRMCEEYRQAIINVIEPIFPELKESEDEMIRKRLIRFVTNYMGDIGKEECLDWLKNQNSNMDNANKEYWRGYREGKQEVIDKYAELEKKSEEKPVDKVEPKFSEEDWVACGDNFRSPLKIVRASDKFLYTTVDTQGVCFRPLIEYLDKHYHLFTLQDVNDGDVLAEDSCIFIIKKLNDDDIAEIYCCLFDDGDFEVNSSLMFDSTSTYPATKEQRDLFFTKMREAGYEWNAERKELKKI